MQRLEAKPKQRATKAQLKERQERKEIRSLLKEHAKDQASRRGIDPNVKREINRVTRKPS